METGMTLRCPHDATPLEVVPAEGHSGHRCGRCEGLWLGAGELASLAHARDFDLDAFHAKLAAGLQGDADFPCPLGHALARVEYRTLELEWCATCRGIWFDAGELRRLLDLHPTAFGEGVGRLAAKVAGATVADVVLSLILFG